VMRAYPTAVRLMVRIWLEAGQRGVMRKAKELV
jgi:hypothetical protein